jgi:adenosylhomocysteine nucleosidase
VLTLLTGVGPGRMEKALTWLLSEPRLENVPYVPRAVICAGYSGALTANLQVGDLILATEVIGIDGNRWQSTWPGELPPGQWHPPLHRGAMLTVPHLVGEPSEKRALGEKYDALAVDMETAVVAQACHRAGIPFGCVRAISDEMGASLSPELVSLLSSSRVSPVKVLNAVLRSPGIAGPLWRLASATRFASARLAAALGELLTLTLPWGGELG